MRPHPRDDVLHTHRADFFLLRDFPDSTMNKILNSYAWVLARSTNLMAGVGTEIELLVNNHYRLHSVDTNFDSLAFILMQS